MDKQHKLAKYRVFPGADVGSDHKLLIANFRLKLKKRVNVVNERKFDERKLKDPELAASYRSQFREKTARPLDCQINAETMWAEVKVLLNLCWVSQGLADRRTGSAVKHKSSSMRDEN